MNKQKSLIGNHIARALFFIFFCFLIPKYLIEVFSLSFFIFIPLIFGLNLAVSPREILSSLFQAALLLTLLLVTYKVLIRYNSSILFFVLATILLSYSLGDWYWLAFVNPHGITIFSSVFFYVVFLAITSHKLWKKIFIYKKFNFSLLVIFSLGITSLMAIFELRKQYFFHFYVKLGEYIQQTKGINIFSLDYSGFVLGLISMATALLLWIGIIIYIAIEQFKNLFSNRN